MSTARRVGRQTMADVLRARGKLGPYTTDVDAAAVRAWAAENGLEVAARGKIPAAVLEAYRKAT